MWFTQSFLEQWININMYMSALISNTPLYWQLSDLNLLISNLFKWESITMLENEWFPKWRTEFKKPKDVLQVLWVDQLWMFQTSLKSLNITHFMKQACMPLLLPNSGMSLIIQSKNQHKITSITLQTEHIHGQVWEQISWIWCAEKLIQKSIFLIK